MCHLVSVTGFEKRCSHDRFYPEQMDHRQSTAPAASVETDTPLDFEDNVF